MSSKQKPYVSMCNGKYNVLNGKGETIYSTNNKTLAFHYFKKNYKQLV